VVVFLNNSLNTEDTEVAQRTRQQQRERYARDP
jgi:hypothetical protein